ncbi:PQQ-dependent sugar dehydrogenase [Rhodococcus sp. X156]|uniref:PQQ-dependent sugar dehydrogenase n=1 Tax=Rhodococcus sp. X156 TaxID=2499145 RepID=UPI000FD78073|nr:PQQ-dependent sugar dehydrogenase [Rhodococcus sp. X156]
MITWALGAVLLLSACTTEPTAPPAPPPPGTPALQVQTVAAGLEHPWDVGFLPDGSMLVTERAGRLQLVRDGVTTAVRADLSDVHARGEAGLMGLLVHPDFAGSRQFSTCQAHAQDGRAVDVRVSTWQLSADGASATRVGDPLLSGIPLNPSGRHSGCRLALGPAGELLVATGDTARAGVAQDLGSLGGKTLRADLATGAALPGAPLPEHPYVWTYGHRNLQGVAVRPGSGQVYTAEHGPDVDDEVNLLRAGANYGWDPSQGGTETSYDESVPMTDTARFPDAVAALWSSGDPTEAVSGATFLTGAQWGPLEGGLVVAALKGQQALVLRLDPAGQVSDVVQLPELDGTHGRLRAVQQGPDGALYVTTDNGSGDELLRVTPTGG